MYIWSILSILIYINYKDILIDNTIYLYDSWLKLTELRLTICIIFILLLTLVMSYMNIQKNILFHITNVYISFIILSISNNLITLYISIELFTYSILFILSEYETKNNDNIFNYYVLNSLSSILFIFYIAYSYKYYGTINYNLIDTNNIFLILFFLFKLSNFPFHYYIYDIYPKLPKSSLLFMFTIPTAYYISLINILNISMSTILLLSISLSIYISIRLGLANLNILKLLTYSTIFNVSLLLLVLINNNYFQFNLLMFNLIFYVLSIIGFFLIYPYIKSDTLKSIPYYLSNTLLFCLFIILLSLIGIPPTFGFMGKYLLILSYYFNYNIYIYYL